MPVAIEFSVTQWKQIALGFAVIAIVLFVVIVLLLIPRRISDERLLGTWQSDGERTIAELQENRTFDEKQLAKLRELFGTLKITYFENGDFTSQLTPAHPVERSRYRILWRDSSSLVMREIARNPSPLKSLEIEQSEITHVHFDGPDSYWIIPGLGTSREYFRRVP